MTTNGQVLPSGGLNSFLGFDISSIARVKTLGGRDHVANGNYLAAAISAAWLCAASNVECCYWYIIFTILEGEFKGCEIPYRFNCKHPNPEVVEIGRGQLCPYLDCIGNNDPQSTDDLCNVPVIITVRNRKSEFTGSNGKDRVATVSEIVRFESAKLWQPPVPKSDLSPIAAPQTQSEQEPF